MSMIAENSNQTLIISVEEARKIMGEAGKNYTDKEIQDVIMLFMLLSDIAIDNKIKSLVQA